MAAENEVGLTGGYHLSLLQCWRLCRNGQVLSVAMRQQRLIAALALAGPAPRQYLCRLLWPESPESRALENLRVSIHRVSHDLPGLLSNGGRILGLNAAVAGDLHMLLNQIKGSCSDLGIADDLSRELQRAELLPGWYDEWIVLEQQRLLQMRVSHLVKLAAGFLRAREPFRAIEAAGFALILDSLNESALTLLVQAHLDAGNRGAALRAFQTFEIGLVRELGIQPSKQVAALLGMILLT